ncbi:MAG: hypothetical protein WB438_06320 [Candidatus Cybelea sp.]
MRAFSRSQGLGIYAAVALAGCSGGSQLASNQIQPNALATRATLSLFDRAAGTRQASGRPWMAPEAKKSDLAYISNFYNSTILAFTYPRGKYVGSISSDDPQGLCAATTGNWWVVASGSAEVSEYAHGGTTPLKTLSVTGGEPAGCTVDPTTGNLAVTLLGAGDVVVFTGGSGSGTTIADDLSSSYFDGYDDEGDLFVDGITPSDTYGVVELPKGGSMFEAITLSHTLEFPGGIQGYGNYLAVGDQGTSDIYHFAIHGTKGKEIGVTHLTGGDGGGFWIQKPDVVAIDAGSGSEIAAIWKYPAGGSPIRIFQGSFDLPIGVTVSVAK